MVEIRAQPPRDRMALRAALVGRQQVYLDVRLVGLAPEVIVADEPVEVEGTGIAGVDLAILHLGLAA